MGALLKLVSYTSHVWIFSMSDNHLASRHDIGDAFRVSSAAGRSKHVVAVPLPALHFPAEYPRLSPRLVMASVCVSKFSFRKYICLSLRQTTSTRTALISYYVVFNQMDT